MSILPRPAMLVATAITLAAAILARPTLAEESADGPVYELRVYTCEPGKLTALNERFRDHTLTIFARHGIESVAYWIPTEGPASETTLIYLLRHKGRAAAKESWDAFRNDPEWKKVAAESQEKNGKILAQAPESTYLAPTDYSPKKMEIKKDCLYELRTYTAAEGKLAALHDRFRQHTDKLFTELGLPCIGYFKPLDEPKSQNVMVYILEHQNRESADKAWKAFMDDPRWQAARKSTEAAGRLTATRPERVVHEAHGLFARKIGSGQT